MAAEHQNVKCEERNENWKIKVRFKTGLSANIIRPKENGYKNPLCKFNFSKPSYLYRDLRE